MAEDPSCPISRTQSLIWGWMQTPAALKHKCLFSPKPVWLLSLNIWINPALMRRCSPIRINGLLTRGGQRFGVLSWRLPMCNGLVVFWSSDRWIVSHLFHVRPVWKRAFETLRVHQLAVGNFAVVGLISRDAAEPFKISCQSSHYCFINQTKEGPFYSQCVHHWIVFFA